MSDKRVISNEEVALAVGGSSAGDRDTVLDRLRESNLALLELAEFLLEAANGAKR